MRQGSFQGAGGWGIACAVPRSPNARRLACDDLVPSLQRVHAMPHPGARRRVRGAQTPKDVLSPQPAPQNAAAALLDALGAEAGEEADIDGAAHSVAADASRRR